MKNKNKFAGRMARLGTEKAFEVAMDAEKLRRLGKDIISFGAGEPDFNTPNSAKLAAMRAIFLENDTHYTPANGTFNFRKAIAEYITRTRKVKVCPENIIPTLGAKIIIGYTMASLINPGDEVICPNPGYPIYSSMVSFFDGKVVWLPLREELGFRFKIENLAERITSKTKLIILNSPQNPTGAVLTESDLKEISKLAVKHNLWVLSDEIYSRINYLKKGNHINSVLSEPGMKERTIVLDGFSKIYAMTGWRLGYAVFCNTELMESFTRLNINFFACVPGFTLQAGEAVISGSQEPSDLMVKEFKERRDLIVGLLNEIPGVICHKPSGAFYVFPNVTQYCRTHGFEDALALQEFLLKEAGVAVLARVCFGDKNPGENQEYIRFSYATSKESIVEGLERIKKLL